MELKGKTREDAFRIGNEIAAKVTASNPPPMELELEKVYHPCMMVSKKRCAHYIYVGCPLLLQAFGSRKSIGKIDFTFVGMQICGL